MPLIGIFTYTSFLWMCNHFGVCSKIQLGTTLFIIVSTDISVEMRIDIDYARSEGDDKNYRIIQLQPSGLECLLISTKTRVQTRCEDNSKAAAAMSVQVGSFADPTVAGMIRLVDLMRNLL